MSRTYRVLHLLVRGVLLQEDELFVQLLCHLHRHFLSISPHTRITVTCTAGHATPPPHCCHITETPTVFPERRSNQSAPACVTLLVVTAVFLGTQPRNGGPVRANLRQMSVKITDLGMAMTVCSRLSDSVDLQVPAKGGLFF